jgi:hypothetical protein
MTQPRKRATVGEDEAGEGDGEDELSIFCVLSVFSDLSADAASIPIPKPRRLFPARR